MAKNMTTNKFNTIIFDFDSTLVSIEGIDELARMNGVYNQVSKLTQKAMDGHTPFESVFQKRLDLIKPTAVNLNTLAHLYQDNLVPGAKRLIQSLSNQGIEVHIVSGGYEQAILPTTNLFGIKPENVHTIRLGQNGIAAFTKVIHNHILVKDNGKRLLIGRLALNRQIAYIGDGNTDAQARPAVDCFIGFGGVVTREAVKNLADHYCTDPNIYSIYNYLT